MTVYLTDNILTGHHKIYEETLLKIENTRNCNFFMDIRNIKSNIFLAYRDRKEFIDKITSNKSNSIIHFLYLDSIYKCPFVSRLINNSKNKYIGTLHWIPESMTCKIFLKNICRKLEYVVVHSEFLKKELEQIGIKNAIVIDYPSFISEEKIKNSVLEKKDKAIFSCLGGTRYDKGLDILCEAFKYIDEESKNKIIFNICGKEQDIKYSLVKKAAAENSINIQINSRFLSDSQYEQQIISSDVILLPYRKIFKGNSGPMTDGVFAGKYIIGPDKGNLGLLIDKYKLGGTFIQEDSKDLARAIKEAANNYKRIDSIYRKNLNLKVFIKKYSDLYDSIEKKYGYK